MTRVPWDAPSRFGRPGLVVRAALRRALRPLTVRWEAEQAQADARVARLDAAVAALSARAAASEQRLAGLAETLADERRRADGLDALLGHVLVRDLPAGVRVTTSPSGTPSKRAICSMGTGPYRDLLARTAVSFEHYARRWGWDLVLSTEDLSGERPAPWGKVPLIRGLLDEYDWILWLDADVVVVGMDADIAAEIEDGKDLYLVEHAWSGEYTANSGVCLLRSSDWARAFLDEVWRSEHHVDHGWWENAAVLELLGYSLRPARLVEPTPWLERTKFLDRRFNSVPVHRAAQPVIVHRGFYDAATRIRQVTGDLRCVLDGAHPITAGWDRPARPITDVPDVRRREELPLALNALGLVGTGVEVGVRKGHYSEWLLDLWHGEELVSVDPWLADDAARYVDISNVSQDEHDGNLLETRRRLRRFGARSTVTRATGAEVAAGVPAETLDFVYLDARHDEPSVADDLACWWPLVRPGGVIAGHDYLDGVIPAGDFGVKSAVDRFFGEHGVHVHATTDDEPWPSWIVRKPATRAGR